MRAALLVALLSLAGCGDQPYTEPRKVCTKSHDEVGFRGVMVSVCDEWSIGCPRPLELVRAPKDEFALLCRLPDGAEKIEAKP